VRPDALAKDWGWWGNPEVYFISALRLARDGNQLDFRRKELEEFGVEG
jgi:hypothetical protein